MKAIYYHLTTIIILIVQLNGFAQSKVIDSDGNVYNTVTIGNQIWFKENLKVTKYSNGNSINNVTDNLTWANLTYSAFCNYNNDSNNSLVYGKLYNWYTTVDTNGLCPTGWHVPTDEEWDELVMFLGGDSIAGGHLKETGLDHWQYSNTGADNSSNFTALPAGYRYSNNGFRKGEFNALKGNGTFWSSTESTDSTALFRLLYPGSTEVSKVNNKKSYGNSVRCICNSRVLKIQEEIQDFSFTIFPYPSIDGKFNFFFNGYIHKIELYDLLGNKIFDQNFSYKIDLSNLSKQLYILKVYTSSGLIIKKIIYQ